MKKFLKGIVPYIVIIIVVVLIRTFLVTPIRVDGPSMNPTLNNGDIMILNKVAKIDRFDIVVIKYNRSEDGKRLKEALISWLLGLDHEDIKIKNKKVYLGGKPINYSRDKNTLIKRVIGLPGETIEVRDGKIYINDKLIKESYGNGKTYDFGKLRIPDDEYFVMGDNREISADSRMFGTFTRSEIKGTTRLTLFPFKRIGFKK